MTINGRYYDSALLQNLNSVENESNLENWNGKELIVGGGDKFLFPRGLQIQTLPDKPITDLNIFQERNMFNFLF